MKKRAQKKPNRIEAKTIVRRYGLRKLVTESFTLYKIHFYPLFTLSLVAALIWKLWRLFAIPSLFNLLNIPTMELTSPTDDILVRLSVVLLLSFFYFCLVFSLGVITELFILERKSGIKQADMLFNVLNFTLPTVYTTILMACIMSASSLLFIFPVFIAGFYFQYSLLYVIYEKKNGLAALVGSVKLVNKNLNYIFLSSLLIWIPVITIHILTRKILFLSITYHALVLPLIVAFIFLQYKKLK